MLTKLPFNPTTIPVESIAGETALTIDRLTADWLRARFAQPPQWLPESVEVFPRPPAASSTPAAVLVPIIMCSVEQGGPMLLLTERTAHLSDHAGQVSFPGGRIEDSDASAIRAALRETEEEIGLRERHIEVLGILPDCFTGTGYQVTPVVALVWPPFELRADPNEVAEIFEVPLSFLMNGTHHERRTIEAPEGCRRTFYAMPYERCFIWGATAGMLRNLFHFLRA